jgi:hypothetical protein
VWSYYEKIDATCAKCSECDAKIQRSNGGTSAMINHLAMKHSIRNKRENSIETDVKLEDGEEQFPLKQPETSSTILAEEEKQLPKRQRSNKKVFFDSICFKIFI